MVLEWSDFSFLLIGSLDEKESENRKCSKLVKNHPINQFWHEKSIGNGFRMIRRLYLDHRFPWWKRVRKSKMFQIGRKSYYKPMKTWEIDWKWFENDQTSLRWSSVPLMKKSPKIVIKILPPGQRRVHVASFSIKLCVRKSDNPAIKPSPSGQNPAVETTPQGVETPLYLVLGRWKGLGRGLVHSCLMAKIPMRKENVENAILSYIVILCIKMIVFERQLEC